MTFLYTSNDPSSINYRIQRVENQLVDSGTVYEDLREPYITVFNNRANGYTVENELSALETALRTRSLESRLRVQVFVMWLQERYPMVRLDHHLPTLLPDQTNDGMPYWDFALDTPIRWSDAHWNPETRWLDPVPAISLQSIQALQPTEASDNLNPLATPFQPRRTEIAPNRPLQIFNPSRILLGQRRIISAPLLQLAHKMGYNLNGNYEGEIDEFAVRNANCPPGQNCSLFIVNVHVDVSAGEFFGLIREGPIFSFHRKLPKDGIDTCAVSLVFTAREAAEAFYYRCNNPGIRLYGRRFRVLWNRERVWPVPSGEAFQSRVVRITGPKDRVSGKSLLDFFGKFLSYTLSGAREKVDGDMRIVEIAFGSIRGQSRAAFKLFHLEVMNAPGGDVFSIEYAPDPCAGGMVELW